jgi:hypothetical protein
LTFGNSRWPGGLKMKNVELDLKQRSRKNRKKRFKNKLSGGIGLYTQAGQKNAPGSIQRHDLEAT